MEDIRADKGNLAELYESVKNMDLTVYTIESAEEFVSALTQTEEILGKENASKKEVAEAEARLIKALAGLEKVPSDEETDYTLAEVVYNAYAGLDMAVYTEESAQAFVTALEAVNDILLDFKAAICDSRTDISHQVSRIDMLLLHEQGHGFACDFLHGSLPATVNSGNDTGKGVI